MPQTNIYEQQFLDALRDIFVGAKVEGDSGYINLMKIKSRYFTEGVFPRLMNDIDAACKPFEKSFREELFDKLYNFFQRYFSESGSIYFRHTALYNNVYEKVYTEERDVMLFWKTHMLYYVKTDLLFNNMDVDVDGTLFSFDVTEMEHKRANEKRDLLYTLKDYKAGKVILSVAYSEKGRKAKSDEILRALNAKGIVLEEETLQQACHVFEKQSEVDYFINKNAKAFLKEQFDLWLYQYVFIGESDFDENRLKELLALKGIAYNIIEFIAQFEDELVRVWNKPKFVLNSHYIITLDKITDQKLLRKILGHEGMKAQVREWEELGMVEKGFKATTLTEKNFEHKSGYAQYRYLPLDTRYYTDLELEVLALFDDLDTALDGWLVHSENYQALNTLLPKFRERVTAGYIDPPYNTAASEIIYTNDYKHSTWLSLMGDRLRAALPFMADGGILCVTIDDYEVHRLKSLIDDHIPSAEIIGTAAIKNSPSGRPTVRGFRVNHEYAVFIGTDRSVEIGQLAKSEDQLALFKEADETSAFQWVNLRKRGGANTLRAARPKQYYPIYVEGDELRIPRLKWSAENRDWIVLDPPRQDEVVLFPNGDDGKERIWSLGHGTARKHLSDLKVKRKNGVVSVFRKLRLFSLGSLPSTWWDSTKYFTVEHGTGLLEDILGVPQAFPFPKSLFAVMDCLRVAGASRPDAIILDFFAGSGTTAHAVINLNREDVNGGKRKYILVDVGEHFNTVILPRVKKVIFSDMWKNGKPVPIKAQEAQVGKGISHFAKYYELEQYEAALRHASYRDGDMFAAVDPYNSYVFLRDLKMLDSVTLDKENNEVVVHLEKLYAGIDLAETLSCVTGKGIKRITKETVEFQDGSSASLAVPDWALVKPLVWW